MTKHQVLIASYRKDFPWLRHLLRSLDKFASDDFMCPVIAVPSADKKEADAMVREIQSHVHVQEWDGPGFGRAQDAMMSGDILCPFADYVWLLGSDCLATAPFSPANYSDPATGLPVMLYNTWGHMAKHAPVTLMWRPGVEKAFGWEPKGEFMRRLPLAYPRGLFKPMREFIEKRHNRPFKEYVWHNVNHCRDFSESNVMGEWAWRHHQADYSWQCLDDYKGAWPALPIVQHWSHGGLDRPRDQDGKTPRAVIEETLGKE